VARRKSWAESETVSATITVPTSALATRPTATRVEVCPCDTAERVDAREEIGVAGRPEGCPSGGARADVRKALAGVDRARMDVVVARVVNDAVARRDRHMTAP
jgi:hypothetical protein